MAKKKTSFKIGPSTKSFVIRTSVDPSQISHSDKVGSSGETMFVQSTSPDTFLRRRNMLGADASTDPRQSGPVKSVGDLDTLYQKTESTTKKPTPEDPREPK